MGRWPTHELNNQLKAEAEGTHPTHLFDLVRNLCILPRDGLLKSRLVDALRRDIRIALLPLLDPREGLRCRNIQRSAPSLFPVPQESPLLPPLCGSLPVHNRIHHPVWVVPLGRVRREGGRHTASRPPISSLYQPPSPPPSSALGRQSYSVQRPRNTTLVEKAPSPWSPPHGSRDGGGWPELTPSPGTLSRPAFQTLKL